MAERFIRCQLCGIPHPADVRECPIHRKPIVAAAKMELRPSSPPLPPGARGSAPPSLPPPLPSTARSSTPPPMPGRSSTPPPVLRAAATPLPVRAPVATSTAVAPSAAPLVGKLLAGRYRVTGVIASGGMGVVYDAVQVTLGRRVAIKCLHARYATDATAIARFQNEAMISGSFGHPHIVEVFDLGWLDDERAPFLVMERLDGETVGRMLLREKRLPVPLVVHMARQALSALVATHARGILHRDLKPDNLFLVGTADQSVRLKVLDFGLSKAITPDESLRLTRSGTVMGTPSYMPPEQATGEPDLDGRVDLYSLGMILYESLTGRLPFAARTPAALMVEIKRVRPAPPRLLRPEVPASLDAVVMKAIARDRDARYGDATQMQRALAAVSSTPTDHDGDPTIVTEEALHDVETQPVQRFARKG